ncbi:hypothetical protein H2O64_16740 [Kordia sp. YSTF-M3]|uniref:Lipoprotein n=1 Tax=Kordia aestuariivivens TaxID=2759037 RepID=A0ABR7QCP7_9FLAO|nr:hypothetical protein [Kordia aestuariivivens]MBC8756324.1 hypothetical protein [Kordia aestuariivivens]
MKKLIILSTIILAISLQSCVQETHEKTVTFKVDMNGLSTVENVGLKGNFTNPSWKVTIPLTDENNDGIYEGTFSKKTATSSIRFKFVNQKQYELKDQPNRTLQFEYKPQTLVYEATFDVAKGKTIAH